MGLLLIAQFGLALTWIAADQTPSFWDPASHGRAALKSGHAIWRDVPPVRGRLLPDTLREEAIAHPALARLALGPVAGPMNWAEAFYRHPNYPSLPFVVAGLALPLTGDEPDALALSMGTLWLLLAILATYLLAAKSFGEAPGLVAAASLAGMPLALGLGRVIMVDASLIAMTATAAWLLVRCNGFRDRRSSLLLGLALGLGMLAKQTFVIVLGPALVWEALRVLRARNTNRLAPSPRWHNLGASLLVAAFVAAPWYVVYLPGMLSDPIRLGLVFSALGGEAVGSPTDPWVYLRNLFSGGLGPFAFVFVSMGSVLLALKGRPPAGRALLFGTALALLFYTFIFPTKSGRFIVAVLPVAALAIAALVHWLPSRALRFVTSIIIVLLAAVTTVGTSITHLEENSFSVPWLGFRSQWFSFSHTGVSTRPRLEDWGHTRVLEAIRSDQGPGQAQVLVIQEGIDYHGELMLRATPAALKLADGLTVDGLLVARHAHKLELREPYYLVAALQRPLPPANANVPGFQWMTDRERKLLDQRAKLREILRIDDLPENLSVAVYHNPGSDH